MFVGLNVLGLPLTSFFTLNIVLVVFWIGLAIIVIREHRRLSEANGTAEIAPG